MLTCGRRKQAKSCWRGEPVHRLPEFGRIAGQLSSRGDAPRHPPRRDKPLSARACPADRSLRHAFAILHRGNLCRIRDLELLRRGVSRLSLAGLTCYSIKQRNFMIRKLKSGEYRLYSRKKDLRTGKRRNLGTFSSRQKAKAHERAIQFFKRH